VERCGVLTKTPAEFLKSLRQRVRGRRLRRRRSTTNLAGLERLRDAQPGGAARDLLTARVSHELQERKIAVGCKPSLTGTFEPDTKG
jgi:hypothetical protein